MSRYSSDEEMRLCREAEEYVVSMGLVSPESIDRMSSICHPKDFMDVSLGDVWSLMVDLKNSEEGLSDKRLVTELSKRKMLERVGGAAEIGRLAIKAPNAAHADYYACEVVRFADIRRIRVAAEKLLDDVSNIEVDPQKVVLSFQASVDGVGTSKDADFHRVVDVTNEIVSRVNPGSSAQSEPVPQGVTTGMPTLDGFIKLLRPGKLYLIGGRTGKGKTALAANIATQIAIGGKSVWFSSLEMTNHEVVERIMSSECNISMKSWSGKLDKAELERVSVFQNALNELRFWVTDKSESFSTIRAKARLRKSLDGLDVLVIDNLQLIKSLDYRLPKHERMKAMTEALKLFAKDLNVAILLLAQLDVNAEDDESDPSNKNWADSKRIVDDADVAMILHRPRTKKAQGQIEFARLIITKNRAGVLGEVNLEWDGDKQKFADKAENNQEARMKDKSY